MLLINIYIYILNKNLLAFKYRYNLHFFFWEYLFGGVVLATNMHTIVLLSILYHEAWLKIMGPLNLLFFSFFGEYG